jgi:ribosomal protein S18 acetylase RimI-like enzyme
VTAAGARVVAAARSARPTDGARLAALAQQARAEIGEQRGGHLFNVREGRAEPDIGALAEAPHTAGAAAWVGTLDEVVVGYAAVRVEALCDGDCIGVISDLYVEPEARAVGVGECLVDSVISWCAAHDCRGIDASALPGNRAAKNFFEESGFTARLLVMHHDLSPADGDG